MLGGLTLWPPCCLARAQYVQKQPVEFDQAINYVNKIKVRNGESPVSSGRGNKGLL